jgi:hypothetical protein
VIVLDEQLMGRGIADGIGSWYAGSVRFITDLRPGTIIKDDAIPGLLREQRSPTFVTINVRDFWQRAPADKQYCIVCVDLPDPRAREIPEILKSLFRHPGFDTKADRLGKVVRVASHSRTYYSLEQGGVESL